MVKDPGKLRLWRIAELLYKQTDETHMLSAAQIDRILSEQQYGLSSNARGHSGCAEAFRDDRRVNDKSLKQSEKKDIQKNHTLFRFKNYANFNNMRV